jgi:hypothetical protein
MEEWHQCPGFDMYEVSSLGHVRSKDRLKNEMVYYQRSGRLRISDPYVRKGRKGVVLSQAEITNPKSGKTYAQVGLYDEDGKQTSVSVHRLVCEAFHGPAPEGKPTVEHDDGNGLNNVATNLYWASYSDQREGERKRGTLPLAMKHYKSIMTTEQVEWVRSVYKKGDSVFGAKVLASKFGVCRSTIEKIARGLNRRSG